MVSRSRWWAHGATSPRATRRRSPSGAASSASPTRSNRSPKASRSTTRTTGWSSATAPTRDVLSGPRDAGAGHAVRGAASPGGEGGLIEEASGRVENGSPSGWPSMRSRARPMFSAVPTGAGCRSTSAGPRRAGPSPSTPISPRSSTPRRSCARQTERRRMPTSWSARRTGPWRSCRPSCRNTYHLRSTPRSSLVSAASRSPRRERS